MKKYWTIIFTLLFAFALSACGRKTDTDTPYGTITGTDSSRTLYLLRSPRRCKKNRMLVLIPMIMYRESLMLPCLPEK
jgi:hypothetical protein